MSKLGLAIAITAEAFKNKLDKAGEPYILHCLRVMNNTQGDEDIKCAAIMHDLIEDTDYSVEKLTELNFSFRTIQIVRRLTHDHDVPYEDYIKSVSTDKDATNIKLRDLEDNSNITRLKGLRKKDFDRLEKYHKAYIYLKN